MCLLLISFISGDSNWIFFQVGYPVDSPTNSALKQTPLFWYSVIKFTKSCSAKCSLHKWVWLRHSIKVSSFGLYKFDPFSPDSGSIPQELVHSCALGCLWVVTVCCNTVGRHGSSFLWDHTHTHSMSNPRWQLHWLPRLTSLPRKSCDWWRTRDSSLGQPTENKID